ncbi:MAG: class I SAM-dependent methyltransferase [Ilumatobacteraceae bacterium]
MSRDNFVERSTCPTCGSNRLVQRYSAPYGEDPVRQYLLDFYGAQGSADIAAVNGADYRLNECSRCGLVFQRFAPNPELLEAVYERWIDPAYVFEHEHRGYWLEAFMGLSREIEMIISYLGRAPRDLSFLDVGMGWGEWVFMAAAYGCNVAGTELSATRRAYVRGRGIEVIDEAALAGRTFDFINTEQVFEHLVDPLGVLKGLVPLLGTEGILKISVPDGADIDRLIALADWAAPKFTADSLNVVAPLEHLNCFTGRSLDVMAETVGLRRIGIAPKTRPLGDRSIKELVGPVYQAVAAARNRGPRPTYAFYAPAGSSHPAPAATWPRVAAVAGAIRRRARRPRRRA